MSHIVEEEIDKVADELEQLLRDVFGDLGLTEEEDAELDAYICTEDEVAQRTIDFSDGEVLDMFHKYPPKRYKRKREETTENRKCKKSRKR